MLIFDSHVCKVVWNLLLWGYAVNYIAILTHSNHSMLGSKSSCDCKMPLLCVRPDHQTVGLAKRSKARLKRFPGLSSSTFIFDVSAFLMQQHFRASLLPFVQNGKLLKLPHWFLFLLDRLAFPVRGEGLTKVLFGSNCLNQTWEGKAWKSPSCPCQQMQTGAAAKSFWIKSRTGTLFPSEKMCPPVTVDCKCLLGLVFVFSAPSHHLVNPIFIQIQNHCFRGVKMFTVGWVWLLAGRDNKVGTSAFFLFSSCPPDCQYISSSSI